MYKPAPPRPKKTNIVRSRTGCKTCRARRKKCDEKKPACSTCKRLGKRCEAFETKFEFKEINVLSALSPSHDAQPSVERIIPAGGLLDHLDCEDGSTLKIDFQQSTSSFAPTVDTFALDLSDDSPAESFINFNFPSSPDLQLESNNIPLAIGSGQNDHGFDLTFELSGHTPRSDLPGEAFDQTPFVIVDPDLELEAEVRQDAEGHESQDFVLKQSCLTTAKSVSPSNNLFSCMDASWISEWLPIPDHETCYINLWDTQCLPILHPVFRRFNILQNLSPLEVDAIIGLSACRLSRALPQKKSFSSSDIPGMAFRPDKDHQALSQHHYRSAMRRVASWVESDGKSNIGATMTVLVLFCYFESSMGNFSEFALHSNGIDIMMKLLPEKEDNVSGFGPELLGAWLQARMQNWWRRFHFSTPAFQSEPLPDLVQPELEATLYDAENRRALILLILCKSLNVSTMALVRFWNSSKGSPPQSSSGDADQIEGSSWSGTPESEDPDWRLSCKPFLDAQSKSIRDWNSRLTLSELPIESFASPRRQLLDTSESLDVQPLYFNTHESAMNYAYYITALVIQQSATEFLSTDQPAEDTEFWISVMLRIAAGIKWEDCVQLNVYTIGFSGLLLACAMRSTNINIGLWIQDWLEERQRISGFEEGSFPVLQILQVLRVVNKERSDGYDVLGIFQPTDDGGGVGKFDSYHSQRISSILVYERCRAAGELLSKNIPLY